MIEPSGLYYPNRFARWYLLAIEEVMGKHGLNTLLSMAGLERYIDNFPPDNMIRQFDFAYLAAISQSLEDMYGARGGRGIALRIGRATFSRGMKGFGMMGGMNDPAFVALPMPKRVELGLKAIAAIFTEFTDQHTKIDEDDEGHYLVSVDISPMAWGRGIEQPVSHALVGIIQEALRYASQGYEFVVFELPQNNGEDDDYVFRVNKTPIGSSEGG